MVIMKRGAKIVRPTQRTEIKFNYKARTPEEVRERAQRQMGNRDSFFPSGMQFFTPREGENSVRILPPPDPECGWGHYGVSIGVHFSIGADKSAYLCLHEMKKEDCPVCEERDRAARAGEDVLAKELRCSFRTALYVIDRAQEGKGPLLWNISASMDGDIVKLCSDPSTNEVLPVDDPNDGYDLSFTREGLGMKTKYKGIQFARKPSPLADDPDVAQEWLDHIVEHRIDESLRYFDAEHIAKALDGQAPASAEEEEEARPAVRAKPKLAAVKSAPKEKPVVAKPSRPSIKPKVVEPEPDPKAEAEGEEMTWDDLEKLNEEELLNLGEENSLDFPESFDGVTELRAWIAEQLEIPHDEVQDQDASEEETPVSPTVAGKGSWREKLKKSGK